MNSQSNTDLRTIFKDLKYRHKRNLQTKNCQFCGKENSGYRYEYSYNFFKSEASILYRTPDYESETVICVVCSEEYQEIQWPVIADSINRERKKNLVYGVACMLGVLLLSLFVLFLPSSSDEDLLMKVFVLPVMILFVFSGGIHFSSKASEQKKEMEFSDDKLFQYTVSNQRPLLFEMHELDKNIWKFNYKLINKKLHSSIEFRYNEFMNKKKKYSKPKKQASIEELVCAKCHSKFTIGVNAGIVDDETLFQEFADAGTLSGAVTSSGFKNYDPELVKFRSCNEEDNKTFKKILKKITQDLSNGVKRSWRCGECKHLNSY